MSKFPAPAHSQTFLIQSEQRIARIMFATGKLVSTPAIGWKAGGWPT